MPGFDQNLLLGTPTLGISPTANGFPSGSASTVGPHHGLIGLVLVAVLVLFLLDRAGFRFAVAVGRK